MQKAVNCCLIFNFFHWSSTGLTPVLSLAWTVLCRPSWAAARLQAGNWDVSLEKLTPSRTFLNNSHHSQRLPPSSEKHMRTDPGRGIEGKRRNGDRASPANTSITGTHRRISKMVQNYLPDPTTGQILQTCPQPNNANFWKGFFSLIKWPFFSCNCPRGISKYWGKIQQTFKKEKMGV